MTTGDSPARDSHHTEPLVSDAPLPFPQLCAKLHHRIHAFLDTKDVSPSLKSLQEQIRTALGVIAEALEKYTYVETRCLVRTYAEPAPQSTRALPGLQWWQRLPRPLDPLPMCPPQQGHHQPRARIHRAHPMRLHPGRASVRRSRAVCRV